MKQSLFLKITLITLIFTILPIVIIWVSLLNHIEEDDNFIKTSNNETRNFLSNITYNQLIAVGEDVIQSKAHSSAIEIGNYLELNNISPELLNNDHHLRTMALKKVGDTGYTCLYECNSGIMRIHPNENLINKDMSFLKDELPDWWAIFEPSLDCIEISGYYDWLEKNGSIRSKYMTMTPIKNTTYMVASTTYIDEFTQPSQLVSQEIDKKLDKLEVFHEDNNSNTLKSTLKITIIVIIISIISILLFSNSITKPLRKLKKISDEVIEGKFEKNMDVKSNNEIGELAKSFNLMIDHINKNKKDIQKYNKNLKSEIGKQTKVLSNKIIESEKSKLATLNIMEDLTDAIEKQKRLERVKTEFLSVTSHELRTPITPMRSQLEMTLAGFFGKISKKQRKSLDLVLKNTMILDKLIEDILDISKIESGNMKFIKEKTNINQLIKDTIDTMSIKAKDKNIQFESHIDKFKPINIDGNRIGQVIRNLINNAIKFTSIGGKITIEAKNESNQIRITVIDTGIGISQEDQNRIFRPFEQVDSSVGRNYEGTGLGLAICKGIVENHGGKIWVNSNPNEGSSFIFTIPYHTKQISKTIELFSNNENQGLSIFRKRLNEKNYELVPDKIKQFNDENFIDSNGNMRYNISFKLLEDAGFIKKKRNK